MAWLRCGKARGNLYANKKEIRVDNFEYDCIKISAKDNDIERFAGAIDSFTPEMIDRYKKVFLQSKMVVAQLKVPKEVTEKLINFCHDNGKFLIFDLICIIGFSNAFIEGIIV